MRRFIWLLLVCCLCAVLPLAAQKVTGIMSGAVTDSAGAVVDGAEVSVTDTATGEVRTAKTSDQGQYAITDLAAGNYDVSVKQTNFKEYISKGVQVFVSSTTTLNPVLNVGAVTEQMTVEATAVQVETATGTVGNVVEGNQVRELVLVQND
jgi:hypothetical protein